MILPLHSLSVSSLSIINMQGIIVKTKIQCENYGFYKRRFFDGGALEVASEIYKSNGIRGFFLGFNAIMGRAIFGNAFGFWGWETSKQLISLDWLASAQKH